MRNDAVLPAVRVVVAARARLLLCASKCDAQKGRVEVEGSRLLRRSTTAMSWETDSRALEECDREALRGVGF